MQDLYLSFKNEQAKFVLRFYLSINIVLSLGHNLQIRLFNPLALMKCWDDVKN